MKPSQRGGLALSHLCPFLPGVGFTPAASRGAHALLCPLLLHPRHPSGQSTSRQLMGIPVEIRLVTGKRLVQV